MTLLERIQDMPRSRHADRAPAHVSESDTASLMATEILEIRDNLLVIRQDDDWLSFALFQWVGGTKPERTFSILWRGEGSIGLRELRHSWLGDVGDEGYIYYFNPSLIADAWAVLSTYFDGN